MIERIQFKINNRPVSLKVDGERPLLWVLRSDLGLTGPKYGCGEGLCGACTVLIDNQAVPSCQVPVSEVRDTTVTTIEGLMTGDTLHPLQRAFAQHNALQCGFCTPGMILKAYSLLRENPHPDRREIIEGMNDNLCRCGAHLRIIDAIEAAAREMRGGRK